MSDIVEFLRARLDEDEAIAEANRGYGHDRDSIEWEQHGPYNNDVWWPNTNDQVATGAYGDLDEAVGRHIARHDPARELREVKAKRQFIDHYAPPDPHEPGKCPDCDMLCAFAAIYSDHPDYRQEWSE